MATNNNNNNNDDGGRTRDPSTNPKVSKLRQLITHHPSASSSSSDGWEKCWEEGVTQWDLGQPTPVVLHLLQTGALRKGRALVPGCGTGYDVVAMASPNRCVLGLNISSSAIEKAKQINDQACRPPFNNSVADYEEVLNP